MTKEKKSSEPRAWLSLFHEQFEKESDRASVILAAAMLDDALKVLLRTYLVTNPSKDDDLFDSPTAPLAAFSSRIDFSYRIGLVSKRLCRDLHLVRKIRNEFAHNVSGCDFENLSVRNRVTELRKSFAKLAEDPDHLKLFGDMPRDCFQICVGWIVFYIRANILKSGQLHEAKEEWAYNYKKTKDNNTPTQPIEIENNTNPE